MVRSVQGLWGRGEGTERVRLRGSCWACVSEVPEGEDRGPLCMVHHSPGFLSGARGRLRRPWSRSLKWWQGSPFQPWALLSPLQLGSGGWLGRFYSLAQTLDLGAGSTCCLKKPQEAPGGPLYSAQPVKHITQARQSPPLLNASIFWKLSSHHPIPQPTPTCRMRQKRAVRVHTCIYPCPRSSVPRIYLSLFLGLCLTMFLDFYLR